MSENVIYYITNCLENILSAPCDNLYIRRRAEDIARAFTKADMGGLCL
ncbi:MAG: hypothetical protein QOH63_2002 [Acidobacteriota bacterium]|jgi:hypothetical protein|nr:hypothetical protein [Acidobacteriota bacterium]